MLRKKTKVIKGGILIDGTGGKTRKDLTILVEGDQIKKIRKEISIPSDADIIDATGKTIMPGLMDMHVHLAGLGIPLPPGEISHKLAMLKTTSPLEVLYGVKNAKDSLEAGFTTLRTCDVVDPSVALKIGIERNLVPGPRLVVAGLVGMTGGHFDLIWPSTWPRGPNDTADGIWEVRKLVRRLLCREGADLIKTCASGGQGGEGEEPWWRNYTVEELKAMVDEAHAVGKKVAAHCSGVVGISNAVEAGIDTIEHCVYIDEMEPKEFDRTVDTMKKNNIIVVPTLAVTWANVQSKIEYGVPEYLIRKSKADLPHTIESFKKIYHAGVKIAMGTDTVGTARALRHGDNAIELELMVKYGMSPMEAIVSATKIGAECAGIQDRTGTIEEGKIADIIVVDGEPLQKISIMKERDKIHLVMKEGRIFVRKEK